MALWSVRLSDEIRTGLTIYQLQDLVRSGRATAQTEVSDGGIWRCVADVPALARALPSEQPGASADGKTIELYGITLQVGPDGKPLPPTPEQIAQMLSVDATPRQAKPGSRVNRWLLVGAALAFAAVLMLVLFQMAQARHAALQ